MMAQLWGPPQEAEVLSCKMKRFLLQISDQNGRLFILQPGNMSRNEDVQCDGWHLP